MDFKEKISYSFEDYYTRKCKGRVEFTSNSPWRSDWFVVKDLEVSMSSDIIKVGNQIYICEEDNKGYVVGKTTDDEPQDVENIKEQIAYGYVFPLSRHLDNYITFPFDSFLYVKDLLKPDEEPEIIDIGSSIIDHRLLKLDNGIFIVIFT